jgi:hypothetical protein
MTCKVHHQPVFTRRGTRNAYASDRAEGATPGARWRMCHMRGSEILRVIEDMTLTRDGLATTPADADR